MARLSTIPAAAPAACTIRPRISRATEGATVDSTLPARNRSMPPTSTGLRPNRSESGPYSSVEKAIATIDRVSVNWTTDWLTPNERWMAGSAGRNTCIEKGPAIADSMSTRNEAALALTVMYRFVAGDAANGAGRGRAERRRMQNSIRPAPGQPYTDTGETGSAPKQRPPVSRCRPCRLSGASRTSASRQPRRRAGPG